MVAAWFKIDFEGRQVEHTRDTHSSERSGYAGEPKAVEVGARSGRKTSRAAGVFRLMSSHSARESFNFYLKQSVPVWANLFIEVFAIVSALLPC